MPRNSNRKNKNSGAIVLPHTRAGASPQRPIGMKMGWPVQKMVRMVYADNLTQSGSSGSNNLQQFRLNSCYDPDLTNAGHQPSAFDQWSLFYNHYCVVKASWEIQITTNGSGHITAGVWVSDTNTVTYTPTAIMEAGGDLRLLNVYSTLEDITFTGSVDVGKYYRRSTKDLPLDSELRALTNANPTEIVYLNVNTQSPSAAAHTTYLRTRLVLDVVFMEPKDLSPSLGVARDHGFLT